METLMSNVSTVKDQSFCLMGDTAAELCSTTVSKENPAFPGSGALLLALACFVGGKTGPFTGNSW